jgi:hypothetical protein
MGQNLTSPVGEIDARGRAHLFEILTLNWQAEKSRH